MSWRIVVVIEAEDPGEDRVIEIEEAIVAALDGLGVDYKDVAAQ